MKKTKKRQVGDLGEDVACKYLVNKSYIVVERNYWKPWGEIDIIAKKAKILHFIEVKTVSREPDEDISRESIRPEENMHPKKIERLHRAIQTYLIEKKISENTQWQLDLACVYLYVSTKKARVEILENIVL